ncbi:MAG TPA: polyprenyl synthetase family protein [Ktedonobacterales bacterium]|jgi:heptaprenyl diphosphate synthase|nr:polyprenyl synthetase family protein [Ktedonobacterales bacterium]
MSDAATLSRLFAGIETDLDLVDATFQQRATSGLDMLNTASAHVLKSPGKRLRTALTLLSGKLLTYRFEKLLPMSVAFEMVHLATLVHDDIIDHAMTRRGLPTVNARYGNGVAILLGDYLFARTAGLIADVEDFRVDRLFSETVASVCEGTILELLTARQANVSVDNYIDRISRKTACLMSACCKGGAIVGDGNEEQIALLGQFGLDLGIAFQIIDDVLDYVGTEESIGKPAGNDLRQGLVTLPLIYALQQQQNGHTERVGQMLGAETIPDDEVHDIVAWVAASPAIEEAMELARQYSSRARALLQEFPSSPERDVLEQLVDFVVDRSR